jgi:hypothetical protein
MRDHLFVSFRFSPRSGRPLIMHERMFVVGCAHIQIGRYWHTLAPPPQFSVRAPNESLGAPTAIREVITESDARGGHHFPLAGQPAAQLLVVLRVVISLGTRRSRDVYCAPGGLFSTMGAMANLAMCLSECW